MVILFILLLGLLLYVLLTLALLLGAHHILFPLGNRFKDSEYFWEPYASHPTPKLLLYLQGNMEVPMPENVTIDYFRSQGWHVMASGYGDSFETTEQFLLRRYDTRASQYAITAIYARSIGTCFAPVICRQARQAEKIRFVIYATPVTSMGEVIHWHTKSLFRPWTPWIPGYARGLSQHTTSHPYHVIVAQNDAVTPAPPSHPDHPLHMLPGVGHNDFEHSPDYLPTLQKMVDEA